MRMAMRAAVRASAGRPDSSAARAHATRTAPSPGRAAAAARSRGQGGSGPLLVLHLAIGPVLPPRDLFHPPWLESGEPTAGPQRFLWRKRGQRRLDLLAGDAGIARSQSFGAPQRDECPRLLA